MKEQLLDQFLNNISFLNQEEKTEISKKLRVDTFSKGTIIQQEEKIPNQCFFVLAGCIRQFKLIDGIEKTIEFFTSKNAAISSESYINQTPSSFSLKCVEESIVIVGTPEQDQKIIEEFPVLVKAINKIIEKEWMNAQSKLSDFKHSTAKERYLDLLQNRPDLLGKVPSHHIASYLGITPESLSRIKKRIASEYID